MPAIEIVVVYNDPVTLEQCFLKSAGLESARLILVDNRVDGKGLPTIFNAHKRDSAADWIVFCHQDFIVFEPDWFKRIMKLSPTACYGPIGVDIHGRFLGQILQTDGSYHGERADMAEVVGLDEQCLIVPRSIYTAVDFDEDLPFDFYVHDYCLEVRRRLGHPTRIIQLDCQHKSRTLKGDQSSERYQRAKDIFIKKHSDLPVLATTTFNLKRKYWQYVDESFTLKAELELIPPGAKVLEIGPGPGHMTQAMRNKGCEVTAIEMDQELARCAEPFCKKIIIGDIERLDFDCEFGAEQFDIVLLGDVLEHLKNPEGLIVKLQKYLDQRGSLVVSIPNIAHGSVRLALLQGYFKYQQQGLLDQTHLRFFTWQTIRSLFQSSGYEIQTVKRIQIGIFDSEIEFDPLRVPVQALRYVYADPEALTYQYVFRAVPGTRTLNYSKERIGGSSRSGGKFGLAVAYKEHGLNYFWNNPPKFRQFFYRSFLLKPRLTTFAYIVASFLPYRISKAINSKLDILSPKPITQTAWENYS
jgi:2-polyprenyl-3-methyl-5-hydroxy-6-metoxy-1,4-benzoquinol methylase